VKWTNKGHELDFIGSRFEHVDRIFLYGAAKLGTEALNALSFLDCPIAFIDRRKEMQLSGYMGKPVLSPSEFFNNKAQYANSIVIITIYDNFRVKRTLLTYGFTEGTNLFEYGWFFHYYLPIFALYRENKLYIRRIGNVITTICSLKCKNCIGYVDIRKDRNHRITRDIIDEIDATFRAFDYADIFYLVGGEPSTHIDIKCIVKYVLDNHGGKFRMLGVTTNGIFSYDDDYIQLLKLPNVYLEWTDYTDVLDGKKKTIIDDNIAHFRGNGINIVRIKHDNWVDFGNGELLDYSDDELAERFHACSVCVNIRDRLVPTCAKGYDIEKFFHGGGDGIPLSDHGNERYKHILLELTFGFTEKGFPDACRFCKGHFGINNDKVKAGEQAE
jgi:hypothetical protein